MYDDFDIDGHPFLDADVEDLEIEEIEERAAEERHFRQVRGW